MMLAVEPSTIMFKVFSLNVLQWQMCWGYYVVPEVRGECVVDCDPPAD